jgi:hypothetical protein
MEYCTDNALTDGLPVVPPTKSAVEWMMTGTTYPRDKVIGLMYPKKGIATVEKIAISAVMAGAKPEYLPVIIAIIETITAKNFNQFHIVNEILPLIYISGPIIKELGINNKVGYLAPGHRINSTIGRSVLICMINIGWRDMKLYAAAGGPGQPAAYANYFIVENQEDSPWGTWAEHNGFGPDESIITSCELNGMARGPGETMSNSTFEERLAQVCGMFGRSRASGGFGLAENAENVRHMIVLHPSFARQLSNAGFTRQSFVQYLYDKNVIDWDTMSEDERARFWAVIEKENVSAEHKAGAFKVNAVTLEDLKPGLHLEPFSAPENVLVMVAGSGAGNTMVFQTMVGSTAPHAEEVDEPQPYMNTVIRGAALTKYGR